MFGLRMGAMGRVGAGLTLTQQAINILRRPGSESHVYIPGVGWVGGFALTNAIMEDGTQAASVDNPMGYMGDPIATAGPELVTNGDFSVDANWVKGTGWTISGGAATHAAGASSDLSQSVVLAGGKSYQVSFTVSGYSGSGNIRPRFYGGTTSDGSVVSGNGSYSQVITANTGNSSFAVTVVSTATCSIDNISVRELVGAIPARQATTANKPILRRGAVNRLTHSENLADAGWTKTGLTLSGNVISGATGTAWGGGNVLQRQTLPLQSSLTYTLVLRVRSAGSTTVTVIARDQSTGNTSQTVAPLSGSDWQFVTVQRTTGAATTALGIVIGSTNGDIEFGGAGCFQGTLSADQIAAQGGIPFTTTAAASSPTGPYWAEFDGTDFLSLAAVPFQQADDHCVVLACRGDSYAALRQVWFNGGSTGSSRWASFFLGATTGVPSWMWRDDAAATTTRLDFPVQSLGSPFVASARRSGTGVIARLNGGNQQSGSLVGMGAATVNSAQIGSLQGVGSNQHLGAIYPVIAIKGTVTDAELAILERWVAQMSGVTL